MYIGITSIKMYNKKSYNILRQKLNVSMNLINYYLLIKNFDNNFSDLDSVSLNNDSISMHYDNMIVEKDELYKIISRVAGKKPLWIGKNIIEL